MLWSSYLGGAASDTATGIALDAAGNIFVAGESASTNWVSGGYQTNKAGAVGVYDAFLAKLASNGSHLWSTFIGGALAETGNGVAALPSGDAIVVGQSASSGWIAGGYDTNWTTTRAYAAMISPQGDPVWSTFLGPASAEANATTVNPAGAIYVAGSCSGASTNWTANGADVTRNGGTYDAFVMRLGADGTHHWSTFYGGSVVDHGLAIAAPTNGLVYLAGYTTATNLWVLGNADATAKKLRQRLTTAQAVANTATEAVRRALVKLDGGWPHSDRRRVACRLPRWSWWPVPTNPAWMKPGAPGTNWVKWGYPTSNS